MNRVKYVLSMKDEGVPNNYIPIAKIFSERKYALPGCEEFWCIGETQLRKMRFDSFRAVLKRYELCKSYDYAKFWNGNLDAINSLGLNAFANLLHFSELASAMVCFQTESHYNSQKTGVKTVSFGIKADTYRRYYKEQKRAKAEGVKPEKVSLYDYNIRKTGNLFKIPRVNVIFQNEEGKDQIVKVRKNALFNQFELWCKIKGITKTDGLYQAMTLIIKEFPVEGLKEVGAYERKCDLDNVEILIPEFKTGDDVSTMLWIPRPIHTQMRQIIEYWNRDPENIGKKPMNITTFIVQAIDQLNRAVPLKYSDPKAYEEYLKAKEAAKYNQSVLKEDK